MPLSSVAAVTCDFCPELFRRNRIGKLDHLCHSFRCRFWFKFITCQNHNAKLSRALDEPVRRRARPWATKIYKQDRPLTANIDFRLAIANAIVAKGLLNHCCPGSGASHSSSADTAQTRSDAHRASYSLSPKDWNFQHHGVVHTGSHPQRLSQPSCRVLGAVPGNRQ